MIQLSHSNNPFEEKKFPVVLVLDSITSPANVGSLFRLADAFNVEKIIFCGSTFADLSSNRLKRTARSTLDTVPAEQHQSTYQTCMELKSQGYTILSLEITSNSKPVEALAYEKFKKMALVLGNENAGIEEEVLRITDEIIHINMFGKNSSMNVAQATGIALFEITKSLPPV